jgi:biotin-dependent carboxylase-like uncharacterized protein
VSRRPGRPASVPSWLDVLEPGPLTTIQDRGRPGRAAYGVGRSGAADRGAAALANRLVANPVGAAVLEITLGGVRLQAGAGVTVALTGARGEVLVGQQAVAFGAPLAVPAGAVLTIGPPAVGLRTYLAVRGGIDVPPVLGSRSRDVLAGLGPPPLRASDRLPVGPRPRRFPVVDLAPAATAAVAGPGDLMRLRGWWGPHDDVLDDGERLRLAGAHWSVSGASDRVGVRLEGTPVQRTDPAGTVDGADRAEWPPEGLVRGAVQLPPSGLPVVMLADHPVTGGYPVVACLDDRSCDLVAQLRPGQAVEFALTRVPAGGQRVTGG